MLCFSCGPGIGKSRFTVHRASDEKNIFLGFMFFLPPKIYIFLNLTVYDVQICRSLRVLQQSLCGNCAKPLWELCRALEDAAQGPRGCCMGPCGHSTGPLWVLQQNTSLFKNCYSDLFPSENASEHQKTLIKAFQLM